MKKRNWGRFFRWLAIAAAVAFFIAVLPLAWTPGWFLYWQVPATIFIFVAYIGKTLINTILFPKK